MYYINNSCFNEEKIFHTLLKIRKIIQKNLYEVILVDNGSKIKRLKNNHFLKILIM